MNAQKIAFFIICFSLAGGIVNGSGIFDTQPEVYTVKTYSEYNKTFAEGIGEVEGVGSEGDLSSLFEGWNLIKSLLGMLKSILYVVFIPGLYLYNLGVPYNFAMAIQFICMLSMFFGVIQFISNRSTGGME